MIGSLATPSSSIGPAKMDCSVIDFVVYSLKDIQKQTFWH